MVVHSDQYQNIDLTQVYICFDIQFNIYDDLTLSYALFGDPLDLVCHNELDIKDTTDTQCPTIEVQIVR